jgi:hypothetical protein
MNSSSECLAALLSAVVLEIHTGIKIPTPAAEGFRLILATTGKLLAL